MSSRRSWIVVALLSLLGSLVLPPLGQEGAAAAAAAAGTGQASVPAVGVSTPAQGPDPDDLYAVTGARPAPVWPVAASETVELGGVAGRSAVSVTGVVVREAPTQAPGAMSASGVPGSVRVESFGRGVAAAAGVAGHMFAVSRSDRVAQAGEVEVTVDYSTYANAFGGGFAQRLRLALLPGCAVTSPQVAACTADPRFLPTTNDAVAGTLTAVVPVDGDPAVMSAGTQGSAQEETLSGSGVVAVMAGVAGSSGDFSATDLRAAGSWQVGVGSGAFTYSYPLPEPPLPYGSPLGLSLDYSSATVDGFTHGSNNQSGWAGGIGWDLSVGFIERSYQACEDYPTEVCWQSPDMVDGEPETNDPASAVTTISLAGQSTQLVKGVDGVWRTKDDFGWRIEFVDAEGDGDGYWKVRTLDGTYYRFGYDRDAVLKRKVLGDDAGEPCHDVYPSSCTQPWRWNLDLVRDRNENEAKLVWTRETNFYKRLTTGSILEYDRAGYLDRIEYGTNSTTGGVPTGKVEFTSVGRCVERTVEDDPVGNPYPASTCPSVSASPSSYPDVPADLICDASSCGNYSQTFFTTQRLDAVTSYQWDPDPEALEFNDIARAQLRVKTENPPGLTPEILFLDKIYPVGQIGLNANQLRLPPVNFDAIHSVLMPAYLDGRVDYDEDTPINVAAMRLPRNVKVANGLGGSVEVTYGRQAPCPNGPSDVDGFEEWAESKQGNWDANLQDCFPVMHMPPGAPAPGFGIFHKYLVKQVVANDNVAGSPDQVTQYDYSLSTATWANTRSPLVDDGEESWSVWRGYREVRVLSGSGTDPARYTVSRHTQFQGMYHDYYDNASGGGTKNTTVTDYDGNVYDDHHALTGKTLQVRDEKMTTYNANPSLAMYEDTSSRRYEYTYPSTADGPGWSNIHKARVKKDIHRVKLDDGSWREDRTETTYDDYGLPVTFNDYNQIGVSDNTCTSYTYARRDQNDAAGSWYLIDFPEKVESWTGDTCGSGTLLARTVNFYDGYSIEGQQSPPDGNITATRIYRDATNYVTANRATFDDMGRPESTTDPAGLTTTITYTPATGWPVDGVTATVGGGFGHTSTVWTSRSTGRPSKTVDANGKTTEVVFDQAGRTSEVYLPGQAKSSDVPSLRFSYHLTFNGTTGQPTAASRVLSESLFTTVGGNQYLSAHSYIDGLGRQRETQTPGPNGGRVVTATLYDARGNTATATAPYYNSSTAGSGLHNGALTSIPAYTTMLYDYAGRVVTANDAGSGSTWRTTTTVYHGDSVETLPPTGGTRTIAYSDVRGNTTQLRQYTSASTYQDTVYTYDRAGRLTGVTDPASNSWTYGYDLAGNRTTTTDPDTGTSTNTYDSAGRVASTSDARNQKVSNEYDGMSRLVARWSGDVSTGTKLASYTYDTLAKGQLTSATRHHAGLNYITAVTGYTNRYQPTGTTVTIPASTENGALTGNYTTTHTYLAGGAPATTVLPAAGGLPSETITHTHNTAGYPTTTSSTQTNYTTTFDYQNDGTPWHSIHGTAGKQVRQTYTVDPKTGRLTGHDIDTENQTTPGTWVDQYATGYTYDPAGNITAIAGTTGTTIDQVECFTYDQLRRLTEAWTQTATGCTTPQRTGADPYRRQWSFDAVGNRLTQTDKNTTDTVWTYQVGAAGGVKPHQVKQVTSTGPLSTLTRTFTYDPAGNTLTRTTDTGTAQTLTWDPEGHLASLTESGATTSYLYDADGRRLITRAPDKTTLYLPDGTELELTTPGGTVLGTRHYGNAVRTTTGLTWVIGNHQNTSTVQIDAQTLTPTRRRAMPFGEPRGTQPTGWTGTKGFVGGNKDSSGLTHLGAREYDPTLGRFISVDPIMDLADPQQWHAYCYSNNNPVTWSDPSGLKSIDEEEERYENAPEGPDDSPIPTSDMTVATYPGGAIITTQVSGEGTGRICFEGMICGYGYGGSDIRDHNALIAEYDRLKATGRFGDSLLDYLYMLHLACGNTGQCNIPWANDIHFLYLEMIDALEPDTWWQTAGESLATAAGILTPYALLRMRRLRCNSFDPDTNVLLADGTTKKIKEIKVGEQVVATDPETGRTTTKQVTQLHANNDELLTDLTITLDNGTQEQIRTTWEHPFWVPSSLSWTNAAQLIPGDVLHTSDGTVAEVSQVDNYVGSKTMYNLTVAEVHTYYVLAGNTPVLVHNTGPGCLNPKYENPGHHDPTGGPNPYNPNKAVLPGDAAAQFGNSVLVGGTRWTKIGTGKNAVYYRYFDDGNGNWHWSGSTNGVNNRGVQVSIPLDQVPISVRRS